MKYLLFYFLFISYISPTLGQEILSLEELDRKSKKKYQSALDCYKKNELIKAETKFKEILLKYPQFYAGHKSLSKSYLKRGKTKSALEELLIMDEMSSKPIPPLKMEIANLAEKIQDFDKGINALNTLLESVKLKPKLKQRAIRRRAELVFRKQAYSMPSEYDPQSIGPHINTINHEYLPSFNADGSELIYSTTYLKNGIQQSEDLFVSFQDSLKEYSIGIPIDDLNSSQNEGAHSFSQDGRIIVYTACHKSDSYGGCDLYLSIKKENKWAAPKNIGPGINSRYWDAQPCIANNNKSIFFSSNRPGGYGGSDLWRVDITDNNTWSEPVNLGIHINTPGNEESPFLHPDNKTFYFRSDGHIGMGDFDLFMTKQIEFNSWSVPTNLGYPINTKGNEGALFVELNGNLAYFASDALTNGDNLDILYFELAPELKPEPVSHLKISVVDGDSGTPITAIIELTDIHKPENKLILKTDKSGTLLTPIGIGGFVLTVDKEKYLFHSENIQIDSSRNSIRPYIMDVELQKIKPESENEIIETKPIVLNNIFFESGSDSLLPESNIEIEILFQLLKREETLKIKIIGHTDNIGEVSKNLLLSEKRARSVYQELIDKGIKDSRILYEGKGESQPIADNNTQEGRRKNRRTEFTIVY